MYDIIYYFFYLLILSVNFVIIFHNITYKKIGKESLLFILINTLIDLIITISGNEFLLLPISTLILIYFSFINFKKLSYSIFTAILVDLVFAASDAITGFMGITIFHINFNSISKKSIEYFAVAIVISVISFILSRLLRRILNKINIENYSSVIKLRSKLYIIFYIGFILLTTCVNIFVYKYFVKNLDNFIVTLNAISVICNFVIVIILLYLNNNTIRDQLQQEYTEKELKQLIQYTDMIETMADDLRRFKHDYFNIMQTLGSYIESNDMKGLKIFYNNELQPENKEILNKNRSLFLLKNIKINSVKGLLSSKVYSANSYNITTHIEIPEEITKVIINEMDICRIMGILFDNAIDSAVLCDEKVIHLAVIKKGNYTSFIITNTCLQDIPPLHKIYEDGFSTKGSGRGLGLSTARQIIKKKYANVSLHTKVKSGVFKQELVIKDVN